LQPIGAAQVRRLLALIAAAGNEPMVLTGELNEWFLWGRPLRWLHVRFGRAPAPATFPARLPFLALDRIWAPPPALCEHVAVHASPLARRASDHLPLRATLAWPQGPPGSV